ncbi:hypothetical protein [Mycobacteroides abscessus]|uniref:hypothetical protein n=1 Tax=Mycobacteroides abscessus TaxID=36809 RepID=UPI000C264BAC|nr:hypothetical protein [Mycobacteroides abscessus]
MTKAVTPEIEGSDTAVTAFAADAFPSFHSINDLGEYDYENSVDQWFTVLQLMYGLELPINPDYQYQPGVLEKSWERADYMAAHALVTSGLQWWDKTRVDDWPELCAKYGSDAVQHALDILDMDPPISELLKDYFALERHSASDAELKITRYAELLAAVCAAYKSAGWERD